MNPITHNELESSWLQKENNELMQKRRRRYLHFDEVIDEVSPPIFKKIVSPKFIERYAFFPLIRRAQKNRLYKKDLLTNKKIIKTKIRPISYAAHFDALIYSWYAKQLSNFYEVKIKESTIKDSVIAYRELGKSNISFAKEVFDFIKTEKDCVAISLDIKGFYDSLDFKILKKAWTNILSRKDLPADHYKVYKSITKFSYVDIDDIKSVLGIGRKEVQKLDLLLNTDTLDLLRKEKKIKLNLEKGIPQGTPISCVLSNLYMFDFDISLEKQLTSIGGLYRRYSDDIIVVCHKDYIESIKVFLDNEIDKIKLIIEGSKTELRIFSTTNDVLNCFDLSGKKSELHYLGVKFNGNKMFLRHKGYAKFERKMTKSVRSEVRRAIRLKVSVAKRKIYEKYTNLGETNYISYAERASRELESTSIRGSIKSSRVFKKIKSKIVRSQKDLG